MNLGQILLDSGFRYEGSCSCDGISTLKYRNGAFQFRWRKTRQTFQIRHKGQALIQWTNISDAQNKIDELVKEII